MSEETATSPARTSPPAWDSRRNNFGIIRLALATSVIVSHAYPQLLGLRSVEPLGTISNGQVDLGKLAVDGFFVISGYLIAASWERRPDVGAYLRARLLRIMPGLVVASLLGIILFAPLGGSGLADLTTPAAWAPMRACLMVEQPTVVPGAFLDTPLRLVNGSLWTIRYESYCYLLVLAIGLATAGKLGPTAMRSASLALLLGSLAVYRMALQGLDIAAPIVGDPRPRCRDSSPSSPPDTRSITGGVSSLGAGGSS